MCSQSIALLFAGLFLFIASVLCSAETGAVRVLYVNNEIGNDLYDGLASEIAKGTSGKGPFASLQKAFSSVAMSDQICVANTGKPYPGGNLLTKAGGTAECPMVIDGHGAVISGLGIVPAKNWKNLQNDIYETDFWPMSNYLKGYGGINHWIGSPQIWWLDGKPAPNCKSEAELKETPCGFFWNKKIKKLWIHLPDGKTIDKVEVKIPVYGTAIDITRDFVVVKNFHSIFSWNDGFDAHGAGKNIVFKNCIATDNCGQGFSCHDTTSVLYEDCLAERCASSGSCDVNFCTTIYRRCVFVNNTFEVGVYATEHSQHLYESCLILGNMPFEQIWQRDFSKMNFINCVISGAQNNTNGAVLLEKGALFFLQCTFANLPSICKIGCEGSLQMKNCIVIGCKNFIFSISSSDFSPIKFCSDYNVYWNSSGIVFNGNQFNSGNWREFVTVTTNDAHSLWIDPQLDGLLKVELPAFSPLHKMGQLYGAPVRIGAQLPWLVLELYSQTRSQYPLSDGTFQGKPCVVAPSHGKVSK